MTAMDINTAEEHTVNGDGARSTSTKGDGSS